MRDQAGRVGESPCVEKEVADADRVWVGAARIDFGCGSEGPELDFVQLIAPHWRRVRPNSRAARHGIARGCRAPLPRVRDRPHPYVVVAGADCQEAHSAIGGGIGRRDRPPAAALVELEQEAPDDDARRWVDRGDDRVDDLPGGRALEDREREAGWRRRDVAGLRDGWRDLGLARRRRDAIAGALCERDHDALFDGGLRGENGPCAIGHREHAAGRHDIALLEGERLAVAEDLDAVAGLRRVQEVGGEPCGNRLRRDPRRREAFLNEGLRPVRDARKLGRHLASLVVATRVRELDDEPRQLLVDQRSPLAR